MTELEESVTHNPYDDSARLERPHDVAHASGREDG